jgi:hypothetical protein
MKRLLEKMLVLFAFVYVVTRSAIGFQTVAWGTGNWWGEYSFLWGALFVLYVIFCILLVLITASLLLKMDRYKMIFERMTSLRDRLGKIRWLLILPGLAGPVWFFQYTHWGLVFSDLYIRMLAWFLMVVCIAFLAGNNGVVTGWREVLTSILLTSSVFVIAVAFINVTDYPFSLGWSEGNRLWDYSILFGRSRYDYPADREIVVLLDIGRQFVGGLPFIFPGLTIEMERFWLGLTIIIPYILLGLVAFRFARTDWRVWALGGLWALVFLKQGPIHPPLTLCATAVALLWRAPLWFALPLIGVTGYIAQESRFTWLFAPGLWIGMLELAGANLEAGRLSRHTWVRAISLGLAGVFGGYYGPKFEGLFAGGANIGDTLNSVVSSAPAISATDVVVTVSVHPLLWYRLFPNATYGMGILAGILIATLPVIAILLYLLIHKKWRLNLWQGLSIAAPLLAFLVVGLIVSVKAGGGGDLHNMDMFLIGLLFTSVIAWKNGGSSWFAQVDLSPSWVKWIMVLLLALPGLQSLGQMRTFQFDGDMAWLAVLTDRPLEKPIDLFPSDQVAEKALEKIRNEIARVRSEGGEVLFLDQRQLLTFGYVTNVPLVPEYEKKILINQAFYADSAYFQNFYNELQDHRFGLIISELLYTPIKDSSYEFGEENNAWVTWVSAPLLCYYEPLETMKDVKVQLLVPRNGDVDCTDVIP